MGGFAQNVTLQEVEEEKRRANGALLAVRKLHQEKDELNSEINVLQGKVMELTRHNQRLLANQTPGNANKRPRNEIEDRNEVIQSLQQRVEDLTVTVKDLVDVVKNLVKASTLTTENQNSGPTSARRSARPTNRKIQTSEQNEVPKISYAKAVKLNQVNPLTIKKVALSKELDDEQAKLIMMKLKSDNVCGKNKINDITTLGRKEFILKCDTIEDAEDVQTKLSIKYGAYDQDSKVVNLNGIKS